VLPLKIPTIISCRGKYFALCYKNNPKIKIYRASKIHVSDDTADGVYSK
jgi:hypothetical protein